MTFEVYVLLGTNLGDKLNNLEVARTLIDNSVGKISKLSKIYETEAWGKTDQPSFYNQIISFTTDLQAEHLLDALLDIETKIGRIRYEKWGQRIIDIDVLYYEDQVINISRLKIPHPEIQNRRFTLIPLVEIAPELTHPELKKTSVQLLSECKDPLGVEVVQPPLGKL
jgi:2-amino-4-hydroxy-6-hydroxymethyldihydropteridine diphosphokinase